MSDSILDRNKTLEELHNLESDRDFSHKYMTESEGEYFQSIIRKCKDICDSDKSVDGIRTCEILQMNLKKLDSGVIEAEGAVSIGSKDNPEGRIIRAEIIPDKLFKKENIVVEMRVTRFPKNLPSESYRVRDEFKSIKIKGDYSIPKDILVRESKYSDTDKKSIAYIEDPKIATKIK